MPFANYCCEAAEAAGVAQVCPECAENNRAYQSAMFAPPEPPEAVPGPAVAIDGPSEGGTRAAALVAMGYNLEELERDNPHNQWMKDIEV